MTSLPLTEQDAPPAAGRGTTHHTPRGAAEDVVRAEQVRLLYGSPFVWLINLLNGPIVAWLLWPVFQNWVVYAWVGAIYLTVGIRLLLWWQYRRSEVTLEATKRWGLVFTLGTFATGLLWGLLAAVIFVTDDHVYHVFVAFVLGGMTAGAAMRNSPHLNAFYAFAIPAALPVIIALLLRTGPVFNAMAALATAFTGVLLLMGRTNSKRIEDNIRLRLEQEALIDDQKRMSEDLTEHVREREQSAAELKEAQRVAHIGSWTWFPATASAEWSDELFRLFGLPPGRASPKSDEVARLMTPQSFAEMRSAFAECQRTGLPFALDIEAVRADGTTACLSLQGEARRNADGSITSLRGTMQDITQRKMAEAALKESEATLQDAQHLAHIGSWSWQPEPDIVTWSDEMFRIFRLDPRKGAPHFDGLEKLLGSDGVARMRDAAAACQAEGTPFTLDLEAKRADGVPIWISMHGKALHGPDGRISTMRGTIQDITERKMAEQSIADLHRQMSQNIEKLQRHDEHMRAIARMSDLLQACQTRSEALPIIAATARTLFPQANGALALIVPGTRQLETVAQWGENSAMEAVFALDACWALRTGRRYDVGEAPKTTPCRHYTRAPAGSSVCLPLTVQGETSGLLHMNCPPGNVVDDEKQGLMTSFADVIKLSFANLKMREILSDQAIRDQLTTLFNRHYLVETLPREILRARRDKVPLSVALLDIDHFKKLNDTFGHDAGDLVLQKLGGVLKDAMRGGDIACRYGGEEFLLVLPECDVDNAQFLLHQISERVKHLQLTHHATALPPITISAGIAEMGEALSNAEALISAADRALYAAKKNGRDRVEIFTPQTPQATRRAAS